MLVTLMALFSVELVVCDNIVGRKEGTRIGEGRWHDTLSFVICDFAIDMANIMSIIGHVSS